MSLLVKIQQQQNKPYIEYWIKKIEEELLLYSGRDFSNYPLDYFFKNNEIRSEESKLVLSHFLSQGFTLFSEPHSRINSQPKISWDNSSLDQFIFNILSKRFFYKGYLNEIYLSRSLEADVEFHIILIFDHNKWSFLDRPNSFYFQVYRDTIKANISCIFHPQDLCRVQECMRAAIKIKDLSSLEDKIKIFQLLK